MLFWGDYNGYSVSSGAWTGFSIDDFVPSLHCQLGLYFWEEITFSLFQIKMVIWPRFSFVQIWRNMFYLVWKRKCDPKKFWNTYWIFRMEWKLFSSGGGRSCLWLKLFFKKIAERSKDKSTSLADSKSEIAHNQITWNQLRIGSTNKRRHFKRSQQTPIFSRANRFLAGNLPHW